MTPPTFLLPLDSADPPPATPADDIIPAHELDAAMFEIVGPAKWVNAVQEDLLKRIGLEGVAPTYAAGHRRARGQRDPAAVSDRGRAGLDADLAAHAVVAARLRTHKHLTT